MAKGTIYDCERAILRDTRSGLRVFRLTHAPTIATNLYFEMCAFTLDERYVVVAAQRYAGRDAPWDLLRVSTDGLEIVQITDADDLSGIVVSPDADRVFYQTQGTLRAVDMHSLEDQVVAELPGDRAVAPRSLAAIDRAGKAYFANCLAAPDRALLLRVDVTAGRVEAIHESRWQNHITVDASGGTVAFNDWVDGGSVPCLIDGDGRNHRRQAFPKFAHNTWFGTTDKIQGTLVPPGHAIGVCADGDAEPTILTSGRYYWHSSASRAGDWIVSDTNWPQEGLYLLHVASGTVTYVCDPRSSCSHPQWTHPHPSLSPGMRYVLFNSDLTGIGQVYVAEMTDEFVAEAAKGYTCRVNAW